MVLSSGTFTLQPFGSFFPKIFIRSGKMHSGTSKSSKSKFFYTFEDIDLRVKLWEQIEFKGLEISICCLPRNFNRFPMYFAQYSFAEMKSTFIKLETEPLPKDIRQVLLILNNSI